MRLTRRGRAVLWTLLGVAAFLVGVFVPAPIDNYIERYPHCYEDEYATFSGRCVPMDLVRNCP